MTINRRQLLKTGLIAGAASLGCPGLAGGSPEREITVPAPESKLDLRSSYPRELLQLALGKTQPRLRVRQHSAVMTQAQVAAMLGSPGGAIDVAWFATSREREKELLPVRIPLDKGLLGWRISIVRADRFDLFRNIAGPADLKRYVAVQGEGWPDVEVLRANALRVVTAPAYEPGFALLTRQKADYFPRSVLEYRAELEAHREGGLVEEPYVALLYPAAQYFFLSKSNAGLAEQIRSGLELALHDGSFDRLFYRHHSAILETVGLERRQLIRLENPFFGDPAPLGRKELWFRPDMLASRKAANKPPAR